MNNIIEYNIQYDIYIEVTDWTEGELQMTIDAKKIISKLSVTLENVESIEKCEMGSAN